MDQGNDQVHFFEKVIDESQTHKPTESMYYDSTNGISSNSKQYRSVYEKHNQCIVKMNIRYISAFANETQRDLYQLTQSFLTKVHRLARVSLTFLGIIF